MEGSGRLALFEIATFKAFASVLIAARKLGTDPVSLDGVKALADLAENGKTLAAALRDAGLAPLARDMALAAAQAERMTHPGPALEDAKAIFWQVAPEAFADRSIFAAEALDAAAVTEAMVRAIKASEQKKDFEAHPLAEPYFREVARLTLGRMLDDTDYIASITPALWREALARQGVMLLEVKAVKDDTDEILSLVRELHRIRETTVPEDTLIAMARKIRPRVSSLGEALRELDRAADLAAETLAQGVAGGNVDDFVDAVLRRLADLTARGLLDEAAAEADAAADRAEAGLVLLLNAAVRQHLQAADAEGAARQIVRRVTLETPDPARVLDALSAEQNDWYERGRDKGLSLDLEVAIALAEACSFHVGDPESAGEMLNRLGVSLQTLGARETSTARLEQAVAVHRKALEVRTRERVPLDWATSQNNLGNALQAIGAREGGTARLREAIQAYHAALAEWTQEAAPLDWATAQSNLGTALQALGRRQDGTAYLHEAVAAYRRALEERTRDSMPLEWAATQNNLGYALATLGDREPGTAFLEEAAVAYRAALEERRRERVPLDWAASQHNLGTALQALGVRESGTAHIEAAIEAYRAVLEVWTRKHVPLDWAMAQSNLGNALLALSVRKVDTATLKGAIAAYSAAMEERTPECVLLDWARTSGNQGLALLVLAAHEEDQAMARAALSQLQEAACVLRDGGDEASARTFEAKFADAQTIIAELSGPPVPGA